MSTVCFTGHRPQKLGGWTPKENMKLLWKLKGYIEGFIVHKDCDTFVNGLALGIDQWAALIVLKLKEKYPHIKLISCVPCKDHPNKWKDADRQIWRNIVNASDHVIQVSEEPYTSWCMQKRNEFMVDISEHVLAVWDGTPGGTANCLKYAAKPEFDKHIYVLNPKDYKE